jgi:hypothetical protein
MEFQIHDEAGKAITMRQLDNEAREFWKLETTEKNKGYSAYPDVNLDLTVMDNIRKALMNNWFDIIGRTIADHAECKEWKNVKYKMYMVLIPESFPTKSYEFQIVYIKSVNELCKPYFELIDLWESKGYKPIHIKQ